jgi:hypothetical protein
VAQAGFVEAQPVSMVKPVSGEAPDQEMFGTERPEAWKAPAS